MPLKKVNYREEIILCVLVAKTDVGEWVSFLTGEGFTFRTEICQTAPAMIEFQIVINVQKVGEFRRLVEKTFS